MIRDHNNGPTPPEVSGIFTKAKVKSRIVITPEHAKRLLAALKDNIEKYEASFGAIKQTSDSPKFPMNFGGTMGQA